MIAPPWAAQEPWVAILVMFLSVGFWIVSSLFKALMEPPRQVKPGPGVPGGPPPVPRAPISLEEFLQEARRRRAESETSQTAAPPQAPLPTSKPKDRPGEPGKRRKNRKASQAAPGGQAGVPVAEIVNPDQQVPQAVVVPEPIVMSVGPRQEAVGKPVADHPLREFMHASLSSPQGIRGSLVLGEILGQPRCRRPYQRPGSQHRPG